MEGAVAEKIEEKPAEPTSPVDKPADTAEKKIQFDRDQQEAIGQMLSRERQAARERGRAEAKAEADAALEEERKSRENDDAAKSGDVEKIKTNLQRRIDEATAEATTAKGETKTLKERITLLEEAVDGSVKTSWDELPEEVRKLYQGDVEDPLAKFAYLNDKNVKDLALKLTGKIPAQPGNPAIPKGSDKPITGPVDKDKAAESQRGVLRNF